MTNRTRSDGKRGHALAGAWQHLTGVYARLHGRVASAWRALARRGWGAALLRVWRKAHDDNLSVVAAGVGFYAMLAIFPAIAAGVSLYGFVADPLDVQRQLELFREMMPEAAYSLLHDYLVALVTTGEGTLGLAALGGVALALWSATRGVRAIIGALNIVYGVRERRGWLMLSAVAIGLSLGAVVTMLIALSLVVGFPALIASLGLPPPIAEPLSLARWLILAATVVGGLAALYRFGPDRRGQKWNWKSPGAVLATLAWLLASSMFSTYVANFGAYDKTYGSLGAVVILLIWFYISAYVVLLGAAVNAALRDRGEARQDQGAARD